MKTTFLKNKGEVFAFFPKEQYAPDNSKLRTCYTKVGQHGACHVDYARESKLATEKEYESLKKELTEVVGYNLEVSQDKHWI